ncbi:ATP-dependent 6-phosphofructokinase [Pseudoalteromonas luteoviolacea]|uniref:6-phosphofructokinase n=1 Tax=Pseudoalteromonas luteoviolacea TaxID=43657 RepID=A0A1C0TNB5_9GAMM|nr:ATP-dependent 6-phosphofructokinase [Pseudoalteromonas luteoviolacea]MBQ4813048.1 6-phosphofructokinase [Pseudoalteromonas luteoviolacea]OCQ20429.1 ATP-dependent 6-phosphofructokinase [Pseudoalteromonas luteoviolacea]
MKRLAIITSGGDAPGMNAAIRAIVLSCHTKDILCFGFYHGYNGLMEDEYQLLSPEVVRPITQYGGTILKSARCPQMHDDAGVKQVASTLKRHKIDALIVIGGDGSFRGMMALQAFWSGRLIGVPATIDNDLACTDSTIGFATAVNTATQAIDKIRDTANAFERVFIVEVMGRHSGHIAFNVGLATAAERILSFENCPTDDFKHVEHSLIAQIQTQQQNNHSSFVIVLAENLWPEGPQGLKKSLFESAKIESAVCVLGYIQRGGSPSPEDRILATELGIEAVSAALTDSGVMIGKVNGVLTRSCIIRATEQNKPVDQALHSVYKHLTYT